MFFHQASLSLSFSLFQREKKKEISRRKSKWRWISLIEPPLERTKTEQEVF